MIDKFCIFLTNKIRKEMPDIDDEKAEIINYGLQNIIGEIPKTFLVLIIAFWYFKRNNNYFFINCSIQVCFWWISFKNSYRMYYWNYNILLWLANDSSKHNIRKNNKVYYNINTLDFWYNYDQIICTCRYRKRTNCIAKREKEKENTFFYNFFSWSYHSSNS